MDNTEGANNDNNAASSEATTQNNATQPHENSEKVNQDELIMAQEKKIADDIKAKINMVEAQIDLDILKKEYANDPVYSLKVESLLQKFSKMRRTRPDGNCFLRGFIFAYLEHCIHNREELTRFMIQMDNSKKELRRMAPNWFRGIFHAMFMEVVCDLESSGSLERVEAVINDAGTSDYLVVYLRLLISAHLQKNAEFFAFFIEGGRTVEEFTKQEVEPMYRECDHLHIVALTTAVGVGVRVIYLDRGEGATVASHDFPEDKEPVINLLYRPGHYDILYKA
ncbi:unnamed protein product, partial [Meganyctiphanes norvegica]